MQHAFEADHLAAVSSIVSRRKGIRAISWHGAVWGIGHTLTLLLIAGTCILFRTTLDDGTVTSLELLVGIVLVLLGAHVLWKIWRDRVHFGVHQHSDGTRHLHAHSHRDDPRPHHHSSHDHDHPAGIPWRTLLVGTVHGMAGSAALVVLTASTIDNPWWGLAYVLLFGLGSIAGMALLSAAIALPLTYTARSLTTANRLIQFAIGSLTCLVGLSIIHTTGTKLIGLA
ncbi:MAG: urease accessory protein [Hyphomicrobiaceae bacterium]